MSKLKVISNILITTSLLLLLFIYSPFLKAYLFPARPNFPANTPFISIPKINAYAPLVDDVDPWNETEYRAALTKGVAIAKGFSKPGQPGTTYIFAHSSDSPWRISSYNTVFFRIGELKEGDQFQIHYNGGDYQYLVSHSIEVWPNQIEEITKGHEDQLILQTCTPIGTSLKRLLVFATLQTKENPR